LGLSGLLRLTILPVAILPVMALVTIPETPLIVAAIFAVLLPVVTAAVLIVKARLLVLMSGHRRLIALPGIVRLIVGRLIALHAVGSHVMPTATVHLARLLHLLLAVSQDDAVVMLRVLQIIFGQHRIACRLSIARKRQIFLGDVGRRAADFHLGSVGLEASR